MKIGVVIINCC